jgi:hypothetical protein
MLSPSISISNISAPKSGNHETTKRRKAELDDAATVTGAAIGHRRIHPVEGATSWSMSIIQGSPHG